VDRIVKLEPIHLRCHVPLAEAKFRDGLVDGRSVIDGNSYIQVDTLAEIRGIDMGIVRSCVQFVPRRSLKIRSITVAPCCSTGLICLRWTSSVTAVLLWPTRREILREEPLSESRETKLCRRSLGVHSAPLSQAASRMVRRHSRRMSATSSGVPTLSRTPDHVPASEARPPPGHGVAAGAVPPVHQCIVAVARGVRRDLCVLVSAPALTALHTAT
jgi:hypothetical protein